MIIIIDAYNLLKTVLHTQFVQDAQRTKFLQLFEKYAQRRNSNEVILVFDGGQDPYEVEENYKYLTLFYSGFMQSADDIIKKKLTTYKAFDILLVTSDRELRNYAKQYQIESLGSMEFYRILQEVMKVQDQKELIIAQTIHKTTQEENKSLDTLMEYGSRYLITKDQDKDVKLSLRYTDEQNGSKKDKKLLKKIIKI
ncbi:NYN domain-containing protein [Candidatus Chromulinivorax destructor]|uniref:NYN domain-containing protein n=1 Tax=Candidatus Chromulinivorax destructor TaxID=2066483 RepID=A0A345ZB44_9BACT|nr:NYN domain-containing protein [Candidatus Chromulinivorax destructor]AXK60511.1 hypothetical protein C0J27_02010 [Candidatus Chromulinivorax destructor]